MKSAIELMIVRKVKELRLQSGTSHGYYFGKQ